MFPWSKKTVKSVTFKQEVADESLLAVVEAELMRQPYKTFSDLCKEALWQFLCVPEAVRPSPKTPQSEQHSPDVQRQLADFEQRFFAKESSRLEALEGQLNQLSQQSQQHTPDVQRQLADFEQRFFAKESSRLEALERQLNQLSQQVAQLASAIERQPLSDRLPHSTPLPEQEKAVEVTVSASSSPQEVDPMLSRLSQFLDDF
jgi:septal ring factor EnvC (AmiA/AmiB activator)